MTDGLRIGSIVLNVSDVATAMAFWAPALGYHPKYEPEPDWVVLRPPAGNPGPNLSLNGGDTSPDPVPHIHLDLYASNQSGEVERLVGLGARRVPWTYPEGAAFVVLADTEDNLFCVINTNPGS